MQLNHTPAPYPDKWSELQLKVNYLKSISQEAIETHLSWVFLTENFAFKMKKPNVFPYLKLDQLHERYYNGLAELNLNQALAPGHYLDLVPLIVDQDGQFHLEDKADHGTVVEWLVKMKRINTDVTLDKLLLRLEEAAIKLTEFYHGSLICRMAPQEYLEQFEESVRENWQALKARHYDLNLNVLDHVHHKLLDFLTNKAELLQQRVRRGKIVECHGDLRPEHICLSSPPVIIDRLEFNQKLRIMDPLDELSYLTLECEVIGNKKVGEVFLDCYRKEEGEIISDELIRFYQAHRACLRAKISCWHLDDPRVIDQTKWKKKSQHYLNLAKSILG